MVIFMKVFRNILTHLNQTNRLIVNDFNKLLSVGVEKVLS